MSSDVVLLFTCFEVPSGSVTFIISVIMVDKYNEMILYEKNLIKIFITLYKMKLDILEKIQSN